MFVTRHKHNQVVRGYQNQVKRLNETIERQRDEIFKLRGVDSIEDELDAGLAAINEPQFIETPVESPSLHPVEVVDPEKPANKLEMPPRSEYENRLKEAMRLFRENHPRSEVERLLNVSRNTARKYLRIARDKRRISAKRYEELNK